MIPRWVDLYQGIPFAEKGSARTGCNCWGLSRLAFGEQTGVWLDEESTVSADQLLALVRRIEDAKDDRSIWREADQPKAFDFLLMSTSPRVGGKIMRVPDHVGLFVSPSHVLHIKRGLSAVCVPATHPTIAPLRLSIHRHVSQI